jgi:transcriptional regulator with XRE-family HTH domain
VQDKSHSSENAIFQRLRRFQVSEGMTWVQVAKMLDISVSMVMMVKRGERNLSPKAMYRLEHAEREVVDRKSRAERVVERLFGDKGTAARLVERESRELSRLDFKVEYRGERSAKSLPKVVTLWKPPEEGCAKLRQLFSQTMDTMVILLACLSDTLRSENYLSQLTADSRVRLTNAALSLVIPEWRTLAAKSTASFSRRGGGPS